MTKNKLVLVGIVVVLLLIVGYLMAKRADAPSDLTGDNNNTEDTQQSLGDRIADSAKTSLAGMVALGKNQSCTFSSSANGIESKGAVLMSGGMMRGDFSSTVQGEVQVTHMISDGKESRIWVDGQTQGYLMKIPEKSDTPTSPDTPVSSQPDTRMPIDINDDTTAYDCTSWSAEASAFTPPANITFVSMEDMMKGVPSGAMTAPSMGTGARGGGSANYNPAEMKAMQCSTCEQVKDPSSKAECLAAFQCQ